MNKKEKVESKEKLRPSFSWGDALIFIQEQDKELSSLKLRYAELEEQTGQTGKKLLFEKERSKELEKAFMEYLEDEVCQDTLEEEYCGECAWCKAQEALKKYEEMKP